jgi:peptidoglycan/LPS O-acetylase OafA/YrhL
VHLTEKDKIYRAHNDGIDILRGIAILSVILLHINTRIPFSSTFLGGMMPVPIYKILFWSGYYGVCIFFVISGFLITTSTLNKWESLPKVSIRGFYFMRFARIMPLLIVLLLILSALHLTGVKGFVINKEQTTLARAVFAALTFHINWLEITTGYLPGAWDILWSLSIEEVFYLFFPILCLISRKEKYFIISTSIFFIISPFARTVWFTDYGFAEADHNHFAYLDAIAIGCIAAIITKRVDIHKTLLNLLAGTGWFLFLFIMLFRKWAWIIGVSKIGVNVTLLAIGTALILIWMQKRFLSGKEYIPWFARPLSLLGCNSYEVYLTHMFVVSFFVEIYGALKLTGEWAWFLYTAVVIISGILGFIIARYFSNPMNYFLRKRIYT